MSSRSGEASCELLYSVYLTFTFTPKLWETPNLTNSTQIQRRTRSDLRFLTEIRREYRRRRNIGASGNEQTETDRDGLHRATELAWRTAADGRVYSPIKHPAAGNESDLVGLCFHVGTPCQRHHDAINPPPHRSTAPTNRPARRAVRRVALVRGRRCC